MGASFDYRVYDGKLTADQLRAKFREAQDHDRHENGRSYSGTIGMLDGAIRFVGGQVLPSVNDAEGYISDHHEKWEPPLAVRARETKAVAVKRPTFGGKEFPYLEQRSWQHTPLANGNKFTPADQLTDSQKARLTKLYQRYRAAQRAFDDQVAVFNGLLGRLNNLNEPFKEYARLKKERGVLAKLKAPLERAKATFKELDEAYTAKLYANKVEDQGEVWVVGGWCAS